MFEREKSKVLELSNGILVPHELRRTTTGKVLRHAQLTIEWPSTLEGTKNHLTDSTESFRLKVITHSRTFSSDDLNGKSVGMPLNPKDGSIQSVIMSDTPSELVSSVYPVNFYAYERLIWQLEYARENPDLVTVLDVQA